MLEMTKNNIEIEEEKGIKNTSLYIKKVNINEESYETKMLLEENIDNVLKFQLVYEGEDRILRYEVNNTIGLDEYLKNNKLKKNDVCEIIDSIDSVLTSIENYLISENSVALDLKLIRVVKNKKGMISLKFIVIPNYNSSFSYELSKFLIRMLRFIDVDDKNALRLAYGLFVRSSKENYTISDLIELIDLVRENKKDLSKLMDIEALSAYDEEMASEIVDEELNNISDNINETPIIEDNCIIDPDIESATLSKNESMDIVMDKNTNDILKEELFENFDKKDNVGEKKIIKFKKKLFNIKPKKMLKAHIIVNVCRSAVVPVACIVIPMLLYLLYGTNIFMKYLPIVCMYEVVLLILYVISSIMFSKDLT